ncbi:hypothetical protein BBK36DRAFT_38350, partial [Trichoderma citrinoviride]
TYLLAPNFTSESDGPIRIGNIIADPFHPTKSLSTPINLPPTTTHTDFNCSISHATSTSLQGSVWAKFLENATGNISRKVSQDMSLEFTMDSLETIRLKQDPLDEEEVIKRIMEPKVQGAIKAGLSGAATVYMITGLKVANGFCMNRRVTTSARKMSINMGFPVVAGVGIGADAGVLYSKSRSESFQSGESIIFAYQLHSIGRKSWWDRQIEVDVYAPKCAFMNADVEAEEQEE